MIWALARDVLVFVVGIELEVIGNRKKAAGVNFGGAEFVVLALIEELTAYIGRRMIRANLDSALQGNSIAKSAT